jgi:hypothetical protein
MPLDETGGDYYFGLDYSREQHLFLRCIAEKVPESLRALKASVLPVFKDAEKDREKRRYIKYGVRVIKDTGKPEPDWVAIWDWARDWRLVKPGDVPWLKTRPAESIAWYMWGDPAYRRHPTWPPGIDWHSSANVFGLATLARVVMRTLETWAGTAGLSDPDDKSPLMWTIPEPDEPQPAINWGEIEVFMEAHKALLELSPDETQDIMRLPSKGEDPPYAAPLFTYTFKLNGWDMLGESRGEAHERLTREFAEQLLKKLKDHERIASMVGLAKHPRVIKEEHFDWLALYQVGEKPKYQIAKEIAEAEAEQSAEYQNAKTPKEKAAMLHPRVKSADKMVALGIADAAELVIGSDWRSWLVPGKPGRRKRA